MAFTNEHWRDRFAEYDASNVNDGTDTAKVDIPHYLNGNFPHYGVEDVLANPT